MDINRIEKISIYLGADKNAVKIDEIKEYLNEKVKNKRVLIHKDLVGLFLSRSVASKREKKLDELISCLVHARIKDPMKNCQDYEVFRIEEEYERRNLFKKCSGILYNGNEICRLFLEMIPEEELKISHCHIVITNQLVGTWDGDDLRWHARTGVFSYPSIVSLSGLVEAPVKQTEYYLRRQMGMDDMTSKLGIAGSFIDHGDPRLTDIIKGYIMQALFYQATGYPFCDDKGCRLYNAHSQADLLFAQIGADYEYCTRHEELLKLL